MPDNAAPVAQICRRLDGLPLALELAAVEAVCAEGPGSVLDGLASLVDQSLVVAGPDDAGEQRYRLLETVRAYGRERLRARGEDTVMRQRLAAWVLGAEAWTAAWRTGGLLGIDSVLDRAGGDDLASVADPPRPGRPSAAFELTRREREVAELAARGLSNRGIAEVLVITDKTAANHLQHVLDKLDLRSRSQLAARAVRFGLQRAGP